jgi:hypothetical protein
MVCKWQFSLRASATVDFSTCSTVVLAVEHVELTQTART